MSRINPDRLGYLHSLGAEVRSQADRVRHLIGSSHWLSDGHHKEYLLKEVIQRHAPSAVLVARGFVVDPVDPDQRSPEQDLLLVDTRVEGPLFNQGGLCVVFPRSVCAAIGVKTTLRKKELVQQVEGLNSLRSVANQCIGPNGLWTGAVFFRVGKPCQGDAAKLYGYIEEAIRANIPRRPLIDDGGDRPIGPDLVVGGDSLVIRAQYVRGAATEGALTVNLHGYDCRGHALAVFLAHLMDRISERRGGQHSEFSSFLDSSDVADALKPASHQFTVDMGQRR